MSNFPEANPLVGRELAGRFQIIEKIGQGGMGAVYKAVHKQMGRTCAIKLLLPVAGEADISVERFKREAQLASRIDNPHAVTIYDFGEAEGGALYLAMEFVEGRHLGSLMHAEHPLASERIVHITRQIAEALGAAHALGIVHRDLKPENIMVARRGDGDYVKVLDFGIAKTFDESGGENITKTGFVLGTPYYMSPEQLSGEKLDARSDIYSLALIVYEMFSGRLPFEGNNSQAVMIKRLTSEPLPLGQVAPNVSPEVERVVMRALIRNREHRPDVATAFARELQSAIFGTQTLSSRPTNRVSDDAGRSTLAVGDSQTNAEAPINAAPNYAPRPTPEALQEPTVAIEYLQQQGQPPQGQSPGQPQGQPQGQQPPLTQETVVAREPFKPLTQNVHQPPPAQTPPSAYITRQTPESAQPPGTGAPSTLPFASESSPPRTANAPAAPFAPPYSQPQGFPAPQAAYQTAAMTPKKSSMGLLLGATAVILLLALAAGVYFLTPLFRKPPIVNTDPPRRASDTPTNLPNQSNDDLAAAHFESGKRHQQQARLLIEAGSVSEADAENQKAIEAYVQAVARKDNYPEAHENLGVAYYNVRNLGLALAELKTAIDQYTGRQQRPTSQVMTNYGLALFDSKRYEEAAEAFTQAYTIDSTDTDLLAFQGFALHQSGRVESAKEKYRSYLRAAPEGQFVEAVTEILAGRAKPPETSGN